MRKEPNAVIYVKPLFNICRQIKKSWNQNKKRILIFLLYCIFKVRCKVSCQKCRSGFMRSFLKMSDQRRHIMLIGSVDFVCTLAFGISTPFVYQEVLGILWCMIIFSAACVKLARRPSNHYCGQ